jgi:carbonic anhydrase
MQHQQIDEQILEREAWALRRQKGIPNNKRLMVIACMDERLPVEEALDLSSGDAHIFRNAGGLVTDDALRSAILTTNFFNTQEIIVVNHTECGMMSAPVDAIVRGVQERHGVVCADLTIDPAVPSIGRFPDEKAFGAWFRLFDDVDTACEQQVKLLREHPLIPKEIVVHGYVYEVESGRLRRPLQRVSEKVNTAQQMRQAG